MLDRRSLIKTAALALGAWPVLRATKASRAAGNARPRFFMQIVPDGGMDAVYTTDAKTTKEVDTGIDIPFPAKDIVETNGARLGPTFAGLAKWMPHLAVVNSFRQNSANHVSGMVHTLRASSRGNLDQPTLLDILGTRRGDEAAGSINIGATQPTAFSPKFLGEPSQLIFGANDGFFEHLDRASPEDLKQLAKVLQQEATSGSARPSRVERNTSNNFLEVSAFLDRVATVPAFALTDWGIHDDNAGIPDLQRALWLFENKLARCVTITLGRLEYDTHYNNTAFQVPGCTTLAASLDRLFTEFQQRKVDGVPIADQICVIVGSEIGRFPRLNHGLGKDHFPQAPYLFFAPKLVRGGGYGATGRDMAGAPISLKTGRAETGGHLLRVDDVGTTLLQLDGADPELFGYVGEHMDFLTA